MEAFWTVCERLESLTLERVRINLRTQPPMLKKNRLGQPNNHTEPTPDPAPPTFRLPRLQNLIVRVITAEPKGILQLDGLIDQCPALRSLEWESPDRGFDQAVEFCNRFEALRWPQLDWILINCYKTLSSEVYGRILKVSKQSFRRLDFGHSDIPLEAFTMIKEQHFKSLEVIDIRNCSGDRSDWALEILSSCPNLRRISVKVIHAQDFLKPGSKPWVCHQLQELVAFIDMGFPDNGPNRKLTEQELGQCREVFQRLATLKELEVLDMLATYTMACNIISQNYYSPQHLRYSLVQLPMRLNAGLDHLAGLVKLEKVSFWGGKHVVYKDDLVWMVEHWKHLKNLGGGWRIQYQTPREMFDNYFFSGKLKTWLTEQGIQTMGSRYETFNTNELDNVDCGDCCQPQDQEQQPEVPVNEVTLTVETSVP
ncbi:hypothetical protein BGX31_002160 [Mortierella sp. GBA43]|nr:hypothetical protein BGX31_002160 [Mortierella sp. GBA43]